MGMGKLFVGVLILMTAFEAQAQDRFEIQVYDSEVALPSEYGLELHLNHTLQGTRVGSPDRELPTQNLTHLTLEPHIGIASWCEVGGYFQTALESSGQFDYAGVKLRFKAKWPRKFFNHLGLSLNLELSDVPKKFEANQWGSELRPAIDGRWGRFYVSVNPIVGLDLVGELARRPQFSPALKSNVNLVSSLAVGIEYYAVLGAFSHFLPGPQQTHRLFGVLDWVTDYLDFNLGAGYGLTAANERWLVKAIVGFHPKFETRLNSQR